MNLQLFLGYKLIGYIPIDPEAAINPKYLFEKKLELEKALSDPIIYSNPQSFAETEKSYKAITADLQRLNSEYETLFEKIMDLESRV